MIATISDNLPQFSIIPNMFGNIPGNLDYFFVDWEDLLKIDELNANNSTKRFLDKTNILFNTYPPL